MDRIDLHVQVQHIPHDSLLKKRGACHTNSARQQAVAAARQLQGKRFGTNTKLNAAMTNEDIIKHAKISSAGESILNSAAARLNLSARSYMRTIKVARTIADLGGSESIEEGHITEAIQYRHQQLQAIT